MAKRLAYVHDNALFMFVDSSVRQVTEETKCKVYNADLREWAPEMRAGSWACRMGPWEEPTTEQLKVAATLEVE